MKWVKGNNGRDEKKEEHGQQRLGAWAGSAAKTLFRKRQEVENL